MEYPKFPVFNKGHLFFFNKPSLDYYKPLINSQSSEKGVASVLISLMKNLIFRSFYSRFFSHVTSCGSVMFNPYLIELFPTEGRVSVYRQTTRNLNLWLMCLLLPSTISGSRMSEDYRISFFGHISLNSLPCHLIHTGGCSRYFLKC